MGLEFSLFGAAVAVCICAQVCNMLDNSNTPLLFGPGHARAATNSVVTVDAEYVEQGLHVVDDEEQAMQTEEDQTQGSPLPEATTVRHSGNVVVTVAEVVEP